MKNTPNLASHTGSENRVARNSVSCFGSSRRRESRPLLGRSGDNLTLLQERVRASIVRVSQKLAAYDKVMKQPDSPIQITAFASEYWRL